MIISSCCVFSHGLHSSCSIFSHGIRGIHRTFLLYILPQIAQIFTDAPPLKEPSVLICEICGSILSAISSVNSVKSVGEFFQQPLP